MKPSDIAAILGEGSATLSQFKDITDPRYVGPGTWNLLHRVTAMAKTKKQQKKAISLIRKACNGFPCSICKGHCTAYIMNNPPEQFIGVRVETHNGKEDVGIFLWLWKFHNVVNHRLGKPIMSWSTACEMYLDEKEETREQCSEVCTASD